MKIPNWGDKEVDIANTKGTNICETKANQSWLQNINFCHHPQAKPQLKLCSCQL
jgi:hypothetical protein